MKLKQLFLRELIAELRLYEKQSRCPWPPRLLLLPRHQLPQRNLRLPTPRLTLPRLSSRTLTRFTQARSNCPSSAIARFPMSFTPVRFGIMLASVSSQSGAVSFPRTFRTGGCGSTSSTTRCAMAGTRFLYTCGAKLIARSLCAQKF